MGRKDTDNISLVVNNGNMSKLPKIIVVLGPTASGKTDLGLDLAKKFNGEIINADSRQVYKEMDIGTAKPAGEWQPLLTSLACPPLEGKGEGRRVGDSSVAMLSQNDGRWISEQVGNDKLKAYVVDGVPHYLMDMVMPNEEFTLADFKEQAEEIIKDILSRGKLPIIVGGTGLYVWSLVDNLEMPKVAPDNKLRAELEKKSLPELVEMLEKEDPESAQVIDLKNPRRVLRALEVSLSSGESFKNQQKKGQPLYDALQIGINWPREVLYDRINKRVDKQMEDGLLEETTQLAKKYDWNLPSMSGIGYKQMGYFLRGEMGLPEAIEVLKRDTRRYAKRQITWFKRDKRINWINGLDITEAEKLTRKFLQK